MKEISKQTKSEKTIPSLDFSIFFVVCWTVTAFFASPFLGIEWFVAGDFNYSEAMYYHAVMIPILILLYLLIIKILPLNLAKGRTYAVCVILSVLFVGIGSIFNSSKGISVATVFQVIGMVMTDCLGIVVAVAMVKWALGEGGKAGEAGMAFRLLLASLAAILVAAPLGHLAGWCFDIGTKSIPGLTALLDAAKRHPNEFQEGLATSHSHLIVTALMSGLAAVAAIYLHYRSRAVWRKYISDIGLWMGLVSLLLLTAIYVFSAIIGWEPPVLFASGPNGIPLDDVVLILQEIAFLVLMVGLAGSLENPSMKSFSPVKANIRISIFANWIFGFIGAVIPGSYIELHEGFYGAGEAPALGALNDNIFIRSHLLYPFLLLPMLFAVALAVGCKYDNTTALRPWPKLFSRISVFGMLLGVVGELLWFIRGWDYLFIAATFVMGVALVAGMISLWPYAHTKQLQKGDAR